MTSYPVQLFELRCRAQRGTLYGVARVAVGRSSPPFRRMFRTAIKQCGFDPRKTCNMLFVNVFHLSVERFQLREAPTSDETSNFFLSFSDSVIVNIPSRENRHHIAYIELTLNIRSHVHSVVVHGFESVYIRPKILPTYSKRRRISSSRAGRKSGCAIAVKASAR